MNHYNTIIIGGGASGMMAGVAASEASGKLLILEKNAELGKKLKITGGGRCNILNAEYNVDKLLSNYVGAKKYLQTPFSVFGVKETVEFFKNIGIDIKIEDRKRAFPKSEKAGDVFNALLNKIQSEKYTDDNGKEENKVEIKYNTKIMEIIRGEGEDSYKVAGVKVSTGKGFELYTANKYILSTGGYSHPETGSTGDGFKLLKDFGIKISEPVPSLVPISVSNNWIKKLSGKTIENIKLTFFVDGLKKKVIKNNLETKNRILFTHFGLSGPTILNNSKYISDLIHEGEVALSIDLFPDMDEKALDTYLLNLFDNNKNKILKNILNDIYAGNILEEIFLDKNNNLSDLDLNKEVNSIKKSERRKLVNIFKNLKINIMGLMGYDKAIIADGGIDVTEINWDNMSLKRYSNLRVTGDMINITRPSGGYSLQLCWTTGYVAGSNN